MPMARGGSQTYSRKGPRASKYVVKSEPGEKQVAPDYGS